MQRNALKMTKKSKLAILSFLDAYYPDVQGELLYSEDYELLIAVVLSAQSTDKAVNVVTRKLFHDYSSLNQLLTLKEEDFAAYFQTLGLFRNKARHVFDLIRILDAKYDQKVPKSKEALLKLPGVGVKTANVVRAELFSIPEIAVDTHVNRIAKRLGFAENNDDISIVEAKLRRRLPKDRWIKTHHQMIHFGRYFCKAQNPQCRQCPLINICLEEHKNLK